MCALGTNCACAFEHDSRHDIERRVPIGGKLVVPGVTRHLGHHRDQGVANDGLVFGLRPVTLVAAAHLMEWADHLVGLTQVLDDKDQ